HLLLPAAYTVKDTWHAQTSYTPSGAPCLFYKGKGQSGITLTPKDKCFQLTREKRRQLRLNISSVVLCQLFNDFIQSMSNFTARCSIVQGILGYDNQRTSASLVIQSS